MRERERERERERGERERERGERERARVCVCARARNAMQCRWAAWSHQLLPEEFERLIQPVLEQVAVQVSHRSRELLDRRAG